MASIWDRLFSQEDYRTAAPSGGYADLYQDGLLARNRDEMPASVKAVQASQDFIPGIGDALALGEAYDAASRGELMAAGLLGTGAAIGLVPGAGDMLARPIMAAGRKASDFADRIEFDPTAFGTVGGNVRLRPAGDAAPSLPAPRNEAEAMAKKVLEMRAAGNAGDVTEDMMALADDSYMFENTPLDMSAEGRMGRAGDLTRDYFHGSNADIGGFDRSTRGTFLSSNPDVSDSYVNRDGGQIYPVAVKGGEGFPVVDGGGALFNRIPESGLPDEFEYMKYDNNGRPFNTDFVVQASAQDGSPGVVFDSIIDRGPNIKTYLGETAEEALARASRASLPSDVTNVIFPHNIRSIFARNDPEFKHLRNLSAGVGGVGLLNAMMEEEQRQKQGLLQ